MDSLSTLSNAQTIAPADSAFQVAAATAPPKSSKARSKRPVKAAVDKDAPPGAVQVAPGKVASGPGSKVVSATIPLTGWGNLDLYPHRRDIEPTFTVDARPYADMVDTVYQSIQSRFSQGGKHIPRSLFRYYCLSLWWYRSLWLHKSNGNVLNSEQKNFLSILSNMDELQVPSPVAQYLGNMGNFLQGGEQYYFRTIAHAFADAGTDIVNKGWLETSSATNEVDDASYWTYAQIPVPAVMVTTIVNEADLSTGGPADENLDAVAPPSTAGNTTYPTENIIGWDNTVLPAAHSSWRATFSQLGWSRTTLPPDVQTQYLLSTSTMKWVSDRLATIRDFKVNGIKQLTLSTQGSSLIAYFLGTDSASSQASQFPDFRDVPVNKICGSRFSDLAVKSRYAIDVKVLAPAFAFGYRLERSLMFRDYHNGVPRFYNRSNYQPWVTLNDTSHAFVDLTAPQRAGMNSTFNFGSQTFINVPRFSTHELNRSVGLDASLILTDTK